MRRRSPQSSCSTLVILLLATTAMADVRAPMPQASEMERAHRMRRVGIGLSIGGVACEVTTIVLWGVAVGMINSSHSQFGEYAADPAGYWPVFGFAVATSAAVPLLLAAGIPLWSVGSRRLKALHSANVTISPFGVIRF